MEIKDTSSENLANHVLLKALSENNSSLHNWQKYKEDFENMKTQLSELSRKFKHKVMVPIGRKCLMKGDLVHTNELFISLGSDWFLKTSAQKAIDVCSRRANVAQRLIDDFKRERKLIQSRSNFSFFEKDLNNQGALDIIENYNEEEEKKWKENHRKREKEYRNKLAMILEENKQSSIKSEEDLWKHLDALDLQEELNDELNRLDYQTSESESESFSEESNSSVPLDILEDTDMSVKSRSDDSKGFSQACIGTGSTPNLRCRAPSSITEGIADYVSERTSEQQISSANTVRKLSKFSKERKGL